MLKVVLVALLCATAAFAHDIYWESEQWTVGDAANPELVTCFQVALKHDADKLEKLEKLFWEVADPTHPSYGKYLTIDQLTGIIAPSETAVQEVIAWLSSVPSSKIAVTQNRDMVEACMSVADGEKLMKTRFHHFNHKTGSSAVRAASELVLPESVKEKLDFIGGANTPIHRYNQLHRASKKDKAAPPAKQDSSTPHLLRVIGGKGEISVAFFVYCMDGQLNKEANPCASTGSPVTRFEVVVDTLGHGERTVILPPSICNEGGECLTTIGMIRDYASIHVKVRAVFAVKPATTSTTAAAATTVAAATAAAEAFSAFSQWSYAVYATDYATPTFLKNLYGIPNGLKVKNPASTQCVAEFLEQYYNRHDLNTYLEQMGLPWADVAKLLGPNNETLGSITGGESQLDIQVIMGMAPGAPTWFWSVPGRDHMSTEEPFLAWLLQMGNMTDTPLVHSVSYGDDEIEFAPDYMKRLNVEFMKLGLRGISLLFASGDDGVASPRARDDPSWCRMSLPSFPAGSPYVTAVGGTQLTDRGTSVCSRYTHGLHMGCTTITEKACSAATGGVITTGGGFSNVFPRPAYQNAHVENYLQAPNSKLPKKEGFFNPAGRGYPDIAAYSSNYPTVMGGDLAMTAGTSASTPAVAAMFTLWNDMRLQAGLPPLGFANPLLYKMHREHPEAFNDIVIGENRCMTYGARCCDEGFHAAPDWDPLTGLGSPKFLEISALLLRPNDKFPFLTRAASSTAYEQVPAIGAAGAGSTLSYVSLATSIAALAVASYLLYSFAQRSNLVGERQPLLVKTQH